MTYTKVDLISKNRCPNFTGVAEHGNRAIFDLNEVDDSLDEVGVYSEGAVSVNIFEDGYICITGLDYNNYNEEWDEKIEKDSKDIPDLENKVEKMLNEEPAIYHNPFSGAGTYIGDNIADIIKVLKNNLK